MTDEIEEREDFDDEDFVEDKVKFNLNFLGIYGGV